MGRNDLGCLAALLFFKAQSGFLKRIKRFSFLIGIIFAFFLILPALGQEEAKKGEEAPPPEPVKFKIRIKYPSKVYHPYKMTEITNVWRQYSDSSIKEYSREVTYFFTQFPPSPPDEGFQMLEVTFDSLRYKFTEGDAVFEFNTQDENFPSSSFFDLTVISVPQGRMFEMTYSPYGEVAKIEGETIDWVKKYVLVDGKDYLDTVQKYIWLKGISYEHLQHLADLQKGIIPIERVIIDSVWYSPFHIELDGMDFYDTLETKITEYKAGIFTIEGTSNKLAPLKEAVRLYGIKGKFVDIDAGRAKGSYKIKVTPRGSITYAEADFYAELVLRIRRERFKQKIQTKIIWELLGQFRFQ